MLSIWLPPWWSSTPYLLKWGINLHSIKWSLTKKSSKPYLPLSMTPPWFPLKKTRALSEKVKFHLSSEHKVKGFADDLSVFSFSKDDHQQALTVIDEKCSSIGLEIRPDKCFSLLITKGRVTNPKFDIHGFPTSNIKSNPTKFLGRILGASTSNSKKLSSSSLAANLTSCTYGKNW